MKNKKWLITAGIFIITGLVSFIIIMSICSWDFNKLNMSKIETNTYELQDDFANIEIETDTSDINFILTEDETNKVICVEESKIKHNVIVDNNTLSIKVTNNKKWYDYIGINWSKPKIDLYLSKSVYKNLIIENDTGDILVPKEFSFNIIDIKSSTGRITNYANATESIKLKASTGDIKLENVTTKTLDISVSTGDIDLIKINCEDNISIKVSTGDITLTDVSCKNLETNGNTGKVILNSVIVDNKLYIDRSTGDIKFDRCDASEIEIKTDTGDVKGSLLSNKIFIIETDTGKKSYPESTTGGICKITTDTGDIIIQIVN